MRNDCEQCEQELQQLRADMAKHFAPEALTVCALSLAGFMRQQTSIMARMPWNDLKRVNMKRDQDFTGAVFGKFLLAMNDLQEKAILKALKKTGFEFDIKNEQCNHKENENETGTNNGQIDSNEAPAPNC